MECTHTWDLVPFLRRGLLPVASGFTSENSDGFVECYKACLVGRGFTRKNDIDYGETFAFVAKLMTVRTLIPITVV